MTTRRMIEIAQHSIYLAMHPPPSGRHAMRSLYGIGRESWVMEMSRVTGWLVRIPPTKWGSIPSSAVCQLAGMYSGRPKSEVIVVVEQTIYSIYNIIVGRGGRSKRVLSR